MKVGIECDNDAILLSGQFNEGHVISSSQPDFARVDSIDARGAKE